MMALLNSTNILLIFSVEVYIRLLGCIGTHCLPLLLKLASQLRVVLFHRILLVHLGIRPSSNLDQLSFSMLLF